MQTIIGRKIDQSQRFLENGMRIPVTLIDASDNAVVQVKTIDRDRYAAIQLGYGKAKKANKATLGHLKKANITDIPQFLYEVDITDDETLQAGDAVKVLDVLKPGDIVEVTGISKGKGWAGGVKRYHFKGGPRTHGQSDRERAPGSIGQTTTPGRVYKGKRMAGRMGSDRVTVKNLIVVDVRGTQLMVSGLVPGSRKQIVIITKIGEVSEKKYVPLHGVTPEEPEVVTEAAATDTVVASDVQTADVPVAEEPKAETAESTQEATPTQEPVAEAVEAPAAEEKPAEEEATPNEAVVTAPAEEASTESVEESPEEAKAETEEVK